VTDTTDLQFERAQFDGDAGQPVCAMCTTPLYSSYFEANGETVCERCCFELRESRDSGSSAGRALRAAGAGIGAALGGSLLYWAILAMTGYEFGLIAIVVGFAVGKAVHWGSRGRGGWAYQSLAVGLTYLSIVGAYVPLMVTEILKQSSVQAEPARSEANAAATAPTAEEATPGGGAALVFALAALLALAIAAPFLGGIGNILGLVIIGIGLYEAWKLNRRQLVVITGPHVLASPSASLVGQ
jgi:hypothetical protein